MARWQNSKPEVLDDSETGDYVDKKQHKWAKNCIKIGVSQPCHPCGSWAMPPMFNVYINNHNHIICQVV